ncbi:MAG TPA: type VI secretion system baseplate subunit TssF [Polyangiaceae bacterium]|nr:type VI secretion system baseplate subunit TssF [Polyangiaceae bacterium]
MERRLLQYYSRELRYLRELGGEFARDFPKIAGRLGLDTFACADPYVERLLEGFAFLAARVQMKIDAEFPHFSEQLLGLVCPHYLAPTPSMAVVELVPDPRQGGLVQGFRVPRGTPLRAWRPRGDVACEYRTAHDVTLWPVEVAAANLTPGATALNGAELPRPAQAVLRLVLRTTNGVPFSRLSLDEVTLFFRGGEPTTWQLHELLVRGTVGVAYAAPGAKSAVRVPEATFEPFGTEDAEALLPVVPRAFGGYRLLSEYFAFPQRLLFGKLSGLSEVVRKTEATELQLLLGLDRYVPSLESAAAPDAFSLNATPVINLFPKRADRVPLSDAEAEYQVVPDRAQPLDFEVHSVLGVRGVGAKGDIVRDFLPFYRRPGTAPRGEGGAFYTVHRRDRMASTRQRQQGGRSSYLGSDVFVSLVDENHGPYRADVRQLTVETLCTNRDLPLLLPMGQAATDFTLESGAPVASVRCVAGPSSPRATHAIGETTWRLISHLSLNYLTLGDEADGDARALRELLGLYADSADPASERQIAGVRSARARPVVRRLPIEGPPVLARGTEITLECDEAFFEGASVYVLGLVLARFLARYASINSFTETVLRTPQRGEVARFAPMIGRRGAL